MQHPRTIDAALVDAYLARRALDYLVGFTLSPVLWRKLPGARSAGRVQSVALRLVCDRELEIEKFVAKEYWSIAATLATPRNETFEARLVGADGQKIQRLDIGSGRGGRSLHPRSRKRDLQSRQCRSQAGTAQPAAALHHLDHAAGGLAQARLCAGHHHASAQRLYEGVELDGETTGLITYMRTDGIDMAPEAIADIRAMIGKQLRQGIRAGLAAHLSEQVEERAGSARSRAPDRCQPHAEQKSPNMSTATRPGSTS